MQTWNPIGYYPCDIKVIIWRANIAKLLWFKDIQDSVSITISNIYWHAYFLLPLHVKIICAHWVIIPANLSLIISLDFFVPHALFHIFVVIYSLKRVNWENCHVSINVTPNNIVWFQGPVKLETLPKAQLNSPAGWALRQMSALINTSYIQAVIKWKSYPSYHLSPIDCWSLSST